MTEDQQLRATRLVWARVGRALAASAVKDAERGLESSALRKAEAAEIAFWQATGQGDFHGLARFLRPEASS